MGIGKLPSGPQTLTDEFATASRAWIRRDGAAMACHLQPVSTQQEVKGMRMEIRVDCIVRELLTNLRLVVVGAAEESIADCIPVPHLPLTIGRSRDNQVALSHPLVSRVHCELFERDGKLFVRDLASTNGTFVGSKRVDECELRPGALLTIGVVTFRAVYGDYDFERSLDGDVMDAESNSVLDTIPLSDPSADATMMHRTPESPISMPQSRNGREIRPRESL